MKQLKFALVLVPLFISTFLRAQTQNVLPEVSIVASSYKYLNAVDNKEKALPIRMLESRAATYDVKKSEFYDNDDDGYYVSFSIPNGKILATYDKDGKLQRTEEKFKNTKLPVAVMRKISQLFPDWHTAEDFYIVNYYRQKDNPEKLFIVVMVKGYEHIKITLNDNGFLL